MPVFYKVTLQGKGVLRKRIPNLKEAEAMAERWQNGLTQTKDLGDHMEVKRDYDSEREWDEDYARAKAGLPQRYLVEREVE